MTPLVLFGVRSPLVVDHAETCRRLGQPVVGVRADNRPARSGPELELLPDGADGAGRPSIAVAFQPRRRAELVDLAMQRGFAVAGPLLDPTAIVSSTTRIDAGSYVNAGCVVASASRIGAHVVINRACNIGHHVLIDDFVSIGPGTTIPGSITLGTGCMIGAGCTLLPGIRIGAGAVISAGSVVRHDVADNALVAGHPARALPRRLAAGRFGRPGEE